MADSYCTKMVGTKPATSQNCNTQACATCKYQTVTTPGATSLYFWEIIPKVDGSSWTVWLVWNVPLPENATVDEGIFAGSNLTEQQAKNMTSYTYNGYKYTRGTVQDTSPTPYMLYEICRAAV